MNYDTELRKLVSKHYGRQVSYDQVSSVYYRAVCKLERIKQMNPDGEYGLDYLAQLVSEALADEYYSRLYSGNGVVAYV